MNSLLFKTCLTLICVFALAACGGSDSGPGDPTPTSEPSQFRVNIASSDVEITTLSSPILGDRSVENGPLFIPEQDEESVLAAYDEDENIIYLGITGQEAVGEEVNLNGETTAKALLLLVPNIAEAEGENLGFYQSSIAPLSSVADLATHISTNSDWSSPTQAFLDLYTAAILASLDTVSSSTSNAVSAPGEFSLNKVVIDNGLTDVQELPTYSFEKTGVNVIVNSQDSYSGPENTFSVEIENSFKRWAVAIIGEDPNTINDNLEIDDARNIFLLAGEGDTETTFLPLSIFEDEELNKFGVHVYGPAIGNSADIPTTGQAEAAYWLGTTYTLLFEVSIPTVGKISGSDSCLREMFAPSGTSKSVAKTLADSPEFRDSIRSGNYTSAAADVGVAMSESIVDAGVSCLTDAGIKLAAKLISFVGHVKLVIDVIDAADTALTITHTLANSESEAYWIIDNLLDQDFKVLGVDYVLAPSFGGPHYHTEVELADLAPEWSDRYSGDCPKDSDGVTLKNTTCEAYSYNGDGPYIVTFEIQCEDPVNSNTIDCTHAEIGNETFNASQDGTVLFNYEFAEAREYQTTVSTYDKDGGESEHDIYLQIKKAEPQIFAFHNGNRLSSTVSNNVRRVDSPVEMSADEEQTLVSETVTLVNTGYGDAEITNIDFPTAQGIEIEFVNFSLPQTLGFGEQLEIQVTVDLDEVDNEDLDNIELNIQGTLGRESIAYDAIDQGPEHGDYSYLEILLVDDLCIENPDEYFSGSWVMNSIDWETNSIVQTDSITLYPENPNPEPPIPPYGSLNGTLQNYPTGKTWYDNNESLVPRGTWNYDCSNKIGSFGSLTLTYYHWVRSGALFNTINSNCPVEDANQTSFSGDGDFGVHLTK